MWKALRSEEALPFSGAGFAASARSRRRHMSDASVAEGEKVGRAVLCPPRRARSARPASRDRRITPVMMFSLQHPNRRLYIKPSPGSFMKTLATIFVAPLGIGLVIVVFVLTRLGGEGFGVLQWSLVVLAVLLAGLIIAGLLNFAVFAPVYWLLGRRHSKKIESETKHDPEARQFTAPQPPPAHRFREGLRLFRVLDWLPRPVPEGPSG